MARAERPLGAVALCLGNPLRGDDAFGYLVYRLLRRAGLPALYAGTAPENVVGRLRELKPKTVVVVDALMGAGPGIRVVKLSQVEDLPLATTHTVPLKLLLKAAGVSPESVTVVGVGVERLGLGGPPSERVREAACEAARLVASILAAGGSPPQLELRDEGARVAGDVEDFALGGELEG